MARADVLLIDLDLSLDNLDQGALVIIGNVRPQWRTEDVIFKIYTAGRCNRLIGCRLKDDHDYEDSVLVRLYGEKTDQLINRDLENTIMQMLNSTECCKPLYAKFNNGIAYGFTQGTCVTLKSIREPHMSRLVAEEMARYHTTDHNQFTDGLTTPAAEHLRKKRPCIFNKIREYLTIARDTFPDAAKTQRYRENIPPVRMLAEEASLLEHHMEGLGSPVVFCHNDLLMDNIVYNNHHDRCYFIDFEFADFNYQAFDIATHFCEWAGVDDIDFDNFPDKPTQINWLSLYLKALKSCQGLIDCTPSDAELERLYIQVNKFTLVSHVFCALCSIIQISNSSLDFDYLGYAKARVDQYYKTKDHCLSLVLPS